MGVGLARYGGVPPAYYDQMTLSEAVEWSAKAMKLVKMEEDARWQKQRELVRMQQDNKDKDEPREKRVV